MSKLANSMPLVSVHGLVDNSVAGKLETHMQEPLVMKPASKRKRLGFQTLSLMTDLELALMRLEQLEQSAAAVFQDRPPTEEQEVGRLVAALHALVEQHDEAGRTIQDYVTEVGLVSLFPKAAAKLGIEDLPDVTGQDGPSTLRDHFARMSTMHQLVSIALQLKDSLRLSSHKYVAHQMALFYQCLGQAGPHFDKFRSRVELEFDAIKRASSEIPLEGPPQLTSELSNTVAELADDVVTEVLFRREILRHVSRTLAGFVQAVST
ncbi:hypothetical protein THASP1DRAFT_26832 [Thamnocephalis sphaerospora]|uniref:Uncharacterized protein n=1 Tax=Thamnocephalis sphaerospora TaxID=78915 RepID=A0A4P9XG72_9FUNG|nr:hypothetical protein THASP1DRAFT_26832 [Thamnocephalis sphaerospora]|eukprot:RKP04568.1 hypothetical protein THASP1DRAFT_26832 [Thamnocephalis sphaerospora]